MLYSICYDCQRTMLANDDRDVVTTQAHTHEQCNPGHGVVVSMWPGRGHCKRCGYRRHGARKCYGLDKSQAGYIEPEALLYVLIFAFGAIYLGWHIVQWMFRAGFGRGILALLD